MQIKEITDLVGTSVRTLHYYDEIGLLTPDETTEAGYRVYSQANLETLQQILFYRELGFSLKEIKEILDSPLFDRQKTLEAQYKMLLKKHEQLEQMIETIKKTIKQTKGEIKMTNKDMFKGFDFSHNPYEEEAREKWGDEAVDKANKITSNMSRFDQEKFNEIFQNLAEIRTLAPDSAVAQKEIHTWYEYLNKIHSYSLDAFKGLGQMYVDDARFTKNIDQFGEGLAVFMRDAMAFYANHNE